MVLVAYTPDKTLRAMQFCRRALAGFDVAHWVLVDNNPQLLSTLRSQFVSEGWSVLEGSNALNEFSGWQEAIDDLRVRDHRALHYLFVNDTVIVHRYFSAFRKLALRRAIQAKIDESARMVGFTDKANGDYRINNVRIPRWIATYCFAVSASAMHRLDYRMLYFDIAEQCISGEPDDRTFFTMALSHDLQNHLRWWLFKGGWRSSAPLDERNIATMSKKAKCTVLEQYLAARCSELDIAIHDPFDGRRVAAFLDRATRVLHRHMTRWFNS